MVERSTLVPDASPHRRNMPHMRIAIRNRGTIGGSLAHAEPAAELRP